MLRSRRSSPAPKPDPGPAHPDAAAAQGGRLSPSTKLLLSTEVPAWYAQNEHIRTGYRPVAHSVRFCVASLGYLHNETANIYTHLVPAAAAAAGNYAFGLWFAGRYPGASWADRAAFHVFLTGAVVCFGVSASYHTLFCHSAPYHELWLRLDYVAIVVQILGSFFSGLYIGFYCEPALQRLYWSMIGILGMLTIFVVVNPRLQAKKYRILRLCTFIATGLSAFAPIIHGITIFPYRQFDAQSGLRYYYLEGVCMLVGAIFYALHFPEAWWPGRFDIWGASHQIFHCFVVLGAAAHFYGILDAFRWNYENPRCRL